MTVRNATELVVLIENTLGWTPPDDVPLWKSRAREAGKINAAIKRNPKLHSLANLELAVEYLRRKRQPVKSPVGVIYAVEKALEDAAAPPVQRPLGELIDSALAWEHEHELPDSAKWIGWLTRASGNARQGVYDEWVATGRSQS